MVFDKKVVRYKGHTWVFASDKKITTYLYTKWLFSIKIEARKLGL